MRSVASSLLLIVSGIVALAMGSWVIAHDIPIYRGDVIIDRPVPGNPPGMTAIDVGLSELLFHSGLAVVGLCLVVYLWRKGVRPNADI